MHIGFTGTRKGMTKRQKASLGRLLTGLNSGIGKFHHGGAEGADTEAAKIAAKSGWGGERTVVFKPKRKTAKELLARNEKIVDASLLLIAAPKKNEEELRSGTWHTIRYARKQKDVSIVILDP